MLMSSITTTVSTGATATMLLACFTVNGQNTTEVAGINLDKMQEAGYRIDWVNQSNTNGLHLPTITSKSFYTIDNSDFVSRYDIDSGKWLWSTPIGNQTYKIKSVTELIPLKRTYVLSEGGIYVIESGSGNYPSNIDSVQANNSQFFPIATTANTPAVSFNNQMVYGSTSGDAVWFSPAIGFTSSTYKIGASITVAPTLVRGLRTNDGLMRNAIVTASTDGTVIATDAKSVRQIWTIKLLDSVESPVSSGTNPNLMLNEDIPRTSVFIAGTDHYLRSVDLHTGRPRWKVLTESVLLDSPFVTESKVYQRIPKVGLASFDAFPNDFSGIQNWVANDVTGTVITTTKTGKLVSWDEDLRILQIVDPRRGGVISTLPIPTAKSLITDSPTRGSLFVITDTDMIIRLDPRR